MAWRRGYIGIVQHQGAFKGFGHSVRSIGGIALTDGLAFRYLHIVSYFDPSRRYMGSGLQ